MLRPVDECVGCSGMGMPCMGSRCPNRNVPHWFCDKCDDEFEPEALYDYNDEMLCAECLLNQFDTVAQNPDKWYADV